MTDAATWMMALSVDAPLAGAFVAVLLLAFQMNPRAARFSAAMGVLGSCLASLGLAGLLLRSGDLRASISHNFGRWFELSGSERLPIDWVLHADVSTAIWTALIAGLGGVTIVAGNRLPQAKATGFAITGALVVAATVSFILAANFVQLFVCWTAVSLTTMALIGCSSSRASSVRGMQRAIQAGLPCDLLLLWAILSIGSLGSTSLLEFLSPADLARIASTSPAFLGLIGSLLVFSILGRCGLFPCFGWHAEAAEWDPRQCLMVYCVGYVPSAIWLLLKCRLLLAAAITPLETAGGWGILGAGAAAFVACGQREPRRRLAYLIGCQMGLLLAALGSGRELAGLYCVWHLVGLTLSAFLLFVTMGSTAKGSRIASWCAALSIAGAIPFSAGWSQAGLTELNVHPVSWRWVGQDSSTFDDQSDDQKVADATQPENGTPVLEATPIAPRWGWVAVLWAAQLLSAVAVVGVINPDEQGEGHLKPADTIPLATPVITAPGGLMLLIAGPCGWWLGFLAIPAGPQAWIGLAIGQLVTVLGLSIGWRIRAASRSRSNADPSSTMSRWNSVTRLSHHRLYIDQVFQEARRLPRAVMRLLSAWLEPAAMERTMGHWIVNSAAWFGTQIEAQQVQRASFSVAAILLGTAVLVLTLILIT